MYNCDTCLKVYFDGARTEISVEIIKESTLYGFVPFQLRDLAATIKNPNSTAVDVWKYMLKRDNKSTWILCESCHKEVMGHLSFFERKEVDGNEHFDTFISYASEDSDFANRLAGGLVVRGLSIWYAPISLNVGDSILQGIEDGLRRSSSGTIIITKSFLSKPWTNYELEILLRQSVEHSKPLVQIWDNVSKEEVEKRYIGLTAILAIDSSNGLRKSIDSIAKAITRFAPLRGTIPVWETPRYRFLIGKGEIQLDKLGGASISLFELLVNFEKKDFPLSLDGELFTRNDLARYAREAMESDFGVAYNWTFDIKKLESVLSEEGYNFDHS